VSGEYWDTARFGWALRHDWRELPAEMGAERPRVRDGDPGPGLRHFYGPHALRKAAADRMRGETRP
jgi:hypothetical protein